MSFPSEFRRTHALRPRRGRLLLECLVAMLLLSAGALAISAGTRASVLLGDDATLVSRAQAQASESAELGRLPRACGALAAPPRALPRLSSAVTATLGAGMARERFFANLTLSPFSGAPVGVLTLSSGRPCE